MHQVFISYCRASMKAHARALHEALEEAGVPSFLDTSDIGDGENIPLAIAEALRASRVVVVFADDPYFTRRYCLEELDLALAPHLREAGGDVVTRAIVVALPIDPAHGAHDEHLPPAVRMLNWSRADETARLVSLVEQRLEEPAADELAPPSRWDGVVLRPPQPVAAVRARMDELPPSIGTSFVGRAGELWRIHYGLVTRYGWLGGGRAGAVAIESTGGVGKTRLVAEYVHRFADRYPGGVFWIDAQRPEAVETQLFEILRTYGVDVDHASFRQAGRSVHDEVARVLRQVGANERILFVIDGVPESSPDRSPLRIEALCPAPASVALLVTSRGRVSIGDVRFTAIPLEVLSAQASIALLTRGMPASVLAEEDWAHIAAWVGHLPLALELLNAALRTGAIPAVALRERASATGAVAVLDAQLEALRGQVPDGVLRSISLAFQCSYDVLSSGAQRLARVLAQLGPASIPVALVDALGDIATPSHRVELTTHSMVSGGGGAARGVPLFGGIHVLLAEFLRSLSRAGDADLETALAAVAHALPRTWKSAAEQALMLACAEHAETIFHRVLERRLPHVDDVVGHAVRTDQGFATMVVQRGDADYESTVKPALDALHVAMRVGSRLSSFLMDEGSDQRALSLNRVLFTWQRRLKGEGHPDSIVAADQLALSLAGLGAHGDAVRLQEQALEHSRRGLGNEDQDTIKLLDNLGMTYRRLGDLPRARAYCEEALTASRRVLGVEHEDTHICMNSVAMIYLEAGAPTEAGALFEEILELRRRTGHSTPPSAVEGRAVALAALGQRDRALAFIRETMDTLRTRHGEDHPETITVAATLWRTFLGLEAPAEAMALLDDTANRASRVLGPDHRQTAILIANQAEMLRRQGQPGRAAALVEPALARLRRISGDRHPDTLAALRNLALARIDEGDLAAGERLVREELDLLTSVLGRAHPQTIESLTGLAILLERRRHLEQALAVREEIFALRRQRDGDGEPSNETIEAKMRLALARSAAGEQDVAIAGMREVVTAWSTRLGDGASQTLAALEALADITDDEAEQDGLLARLAAAYAERHGSSSIAALDAIGRRVARWRGDIATARALVEPALALARAIHPEHEITASLVALLAQLVDRSGDRRSLRRLREEHVELCERVFGPESEVTLESIGMLAVAAARDGDRAAAADLHRRALDVSQRALGPEHPDTIAHMDMLGAALRAQGQLAEAYDLGRRAMGLSERVFGPQDRHTIVCLANLAGTAAARGSHEEASALIAEAVKRAQHADVDPEVLVDVLQQQGSLARLRGDLKTMRAAYQLLAATCARHLGSTDIATLRARNEWAAATGRLGALAEAISILDAALADARAADLRDECRIFLALNLVGFLEQQGELARAREIATEELAWSIDSFGDRSPNTALAAWTRYGVLARGGDEAAAREVFARHLKWVRALDREACQGLLGMVRDFLEQVFAVNAGPPAGSR